MKKVSEFFLVLEVYFFNTVWLVKNDKAKLGEIAKVLSPLSTLSDGSNEIRNDIEKKSK